MKEVFINMSECVYQKPYSHSSECSSLSIFSLQNEQGAQVLLVPVLSSLRNDIGYPTPAMAYMKPRCEINPISHGWLLGKYFALQKGTYS